MKWLYYIIIVIIAFCIGFGTGRYIKLSENHVTPDTITSIERFIEIKHDTLLSVSPLPILAYFSSKDSVRIGDTILPKEVKVYQDSTYRAVISGIDVNIDSLAIFPQTITIHDIVTRDITNFVKPRKWSIGIQAGYGMTNKGLSPYIGIGISYRLY